MQKKLLTMAVAGALAAPCIALAQSSVEVYGTINMAFGKFKYSEGNSVATNGAGNVTTPSISKWDVSQGASNYGLRGRENVGGGLTAWFQIEQNAPMERSNNIAITPASRNSAVGIQGGFGNVFIGQWTTPWADLDSLWAIGNVGFWGPVTSVIGRRETTGTSPSANCANLGHGVPGTCDAVEASGGVGHPFWRRVSQAAFYQSPVFSGVQIKVAYQTNESKSNGAVATRSNADPSLWSTSVQWAGLGGRARIGLGYDRHKDHSSIGQSDTGWAVKGGWNFGVVDVGLAYERTKYRCGGTSFDVPGTAPAAGANSTFTCGATAGAAGVVSGDVNQHNMGIALAVPVGMGSIRASYARASDLTGGGFEGVFPDTGSKEMNIGYEHRFSKRTNVGVGYAKIENKRNSNMSWTGMPPNGFNGQPLSTLGSNPSTYFVSITHRF